jgi:hypothetical protein
MATDTLLELKAQRDEHLKVMQTTEESMSAESVTNDQFKELKAQFDEADAKVGELNEKIKAEYDRGQTRQEMDAIRKAREIRAADTKKIDETLLRRTASTRDRLTAGIRGEERHASRDFQLAIGAWSMYTASAGASGLDEEQRQACERLGINPASTRLFNDPGLHREWASQIFRVENGRTVAGLPMAGVNDPIDSRDGTFAGILNRPPQYSQTLAINAYSHSGILKAPIRVLNTDHADELVDGFYDDSMNEGVATGEGQNTLSLVNGKAGEIYLRAYQRSSRSMGFGYVAMLKNRYGLPDRIPEFLGERLGKITGREFTIGTGLAGQPQGIVTFAAAGGCVTSTQTTDVISRKDLRYMVTNSIDHMYLDANAGTCGWMMHQDTWAHIATEIADGEDRPIHAIQREFQNNRMVFTLEGFPIYINYAMPRFTGAATGANLILFGCFDRFTVRYALNSQVPYLVRDDVTGINNMETYFTAHQWVDSRGYDYGNPPFCLLKNG